MSNETKSFLMGFVLGLLVMGLLSCGHEDDIVTDCPVQYEELK